MQLRAQPPASTNHHAKHGKYGKTRIIRGVARSRAVPASRRTATPASCAKRAASDDAPELLLGLRRSTTRPRAAASSRRAKTRPRAAPRFAAIDVARHELRHVRGERCGPELLLGSRCVRRRPRAAPRLVAIDDALHELRQARRERHAPSCSSARVRATPPTHCDDTATETSETPRRRRPRAAPTRRAPLVLRAEYTDDSSHPQPSAEGREASGSRLVA